MGWLSKVKEVELFIYVGNKIMTVKEYERLRGG
jgi:hypothetical protein